MTQIAPIFWHAKKAADSLQIEWHENENVALNDASIFRQWVELEKTEEGDRKAEEGNQQAEESER